jgi:hypothetical protein
MYLRGGSRLHVSEPTERRTTMNRMTPDLARLLVEERLTEAEQHRQRQAASRRDAGTVKVPRQRRAGTLLNRVLPGYGVRVPTR